MTKGWLIRRTLVLNCAPLSLPYASQNCRELQCAPKWITRALRPISSPVGHCVFNSCCAVRRDFECIRFVAEQRVILWPSTVHRTERHATLQIAEDSLSHWVAADYEPDDPEQNHKACWAQHGNEGSLPGLHVGDLTLWLASMWHRG